MPKYQFVAEKDGAVMFFGLHDTREEAEKARVAFIMVHCQYAWAESLKDNAELLARHGVWADPEKLSPEETEVLVVAYFETWWSKHVGWATRIEELDEGDFMCPVCGQTKRLTILCDPAWATYDNEEGEWKDHGGHEYGDESKAECPECDHKGVWRDFSVA